MVELIPSALYPISFFLAVVILHIVFRGTSLSENYLYRSIENSLQVSARSLPVVGILVVLLLQLWNIGYLPSEFDLDQGVHSLISLNFAKGYDLTYECYVSRFAYLYPPWQIFLGFLFKLFGPSKSVAALGTVLIGVMTVLVFFLFSRKVFPNIALALTFLFSCSCWLFPFWMHGMGPFASMPLWTVLVFYLYYQMNNHKHNRYYALLLAVVLGISLFNGYIHILVVYPILLISNFLLNQGRKRFLNLNLLIIFLLSLLVYCCLVFLVMKYVYHNNVSDYFAAFRSVIHSRTPKVSAKTCQWINNAKWIWRTMFLDAVGREPNYMFNLYYMRGCPWITVNLSLLLGVGLFYSWSVRTNLSYVLNTWLFITLLFYIFYLKPTARYLVMLAPCVYLLCGMGLDFLYRLAARKNWTAYFSGLVLLIGLAEFTNLNNGLSDYFNESFFGKSKTPNEHFGFSQLGDYFKNEVTSQNEPVTLVCGPYIGGIQSGILDFVTNRTFLGKSISWKTFKKTITEQNVTDTCYFVFSSKLFKKSRIEEFEDYFPGIAPVKTVFYNDGKERMHVYKLQPPWFKVRFGASFSSKYEGLFDVYAQRDLSLSESFPDESKETLFFCRTTFRDWSVIENNVSSEIEADDLTGLTARIIFDGDKNEDEWTRIEKKMDIDLVKHPILALLYRVENPRLQTYGIVADLDFDGDGSVDGVVKTHVPSPQAYIHTFKWDLFRAAKKKYQYLPFDSCRLLRLEIYFHKVWGTDCSSVDTALKFVLKRLYFLPVGLTDSIRDKSCIVSTTGHYIDFSKGQVLAGFQRNDNSMKSDLDEQAFQIVSPCPNINPQDFPVMRIRFKHKKKQQKVRIIITFSIQGRLKNILIDELDFSYHIPERIDYDLYKILSLDPNDSMVRIVGISISGENPPLPAEITLPLENILAIQFLDQHPSSIDQVTLGGNFNGEAVSWNSRYSIVSSEKVRFLFFARIPVRKGLNEWVPEWTITPADAFFSERKKT